MLNESLGGKRRGGDPAFSPIKHKVLRLTMIPGMTPRYQISDFPNVLFQRQELRRATGNETLPPRTVLRKGAKGKIVKLHERRKNKNRIEFLVERRGDKPENWEWVLRTELMKTVPELVKQFR